MGYRASTMLLSDVPDGQLETPGHDARALLAWAKAPPSGMRDMMLGWLRNCVDRQRRVEAGKPNCRMATRQFFDRDRGLWMYRPCAFVPAEGYEFCWRHGGPTKQRRHAAPRSAMKPR